MEAEKYTGGTVYSAVGEVRSRQSGVTPRTSHTGFKTHKSILFFLHKSILILYTFKAYI